MVKYSRCVVAFCGHCQQRDRGCIYANFPKDIERCRKWLKLAGVDELVYLPPEKLNEIRYVCGCHFTDDQFSNANHTRLKRTAVPSKFDVRTKPLDDEFVNQYPLAKDYTPAPAPRRRVKKPTANTKIQTTPPLILPKKGEIQELPVVQSLTGCQEKCQKQIEQVSEADSAVTCTPNGDPNGVNGVQELVEDKPLDDVSNQVESDSSSENDWTITDESHVKTEEKISLPLTSVSAAEGVLAPKKLSGAGKKPLRKSNSLYKTRIGRKKLKHVGDLRKGPHSSTVQTSSLPSTSNTMPVIDDSSSTKTEETFENSIHLKNIVNTTHRTLLPQLEYDEFISCVGRSIKKMEPSVAKEVMINIREILNRNNAKCIVKQ